MMKGLFTKKFMDDGFFDQFYRCNYFPGMLKVIKKHMIKIIRAVDKHNAGG